MTGATDLFNRTSRGEIQAGSGCGQGYENCGLRCRFARKAREEGQRRVALRGITLSGRDETSWHTGGVGWGGGGTGEGRAKSGQRGREVGETRVSK